MQHPFIIYQAILTLAKSSYYNYFFLAIKLSKRILKLYERPKQLKD